MLVGHQGYVPEPYFLTETLHSQHRFHDPLEESLFSHSASVEGFREWSGRTTPMGSPRTSTFSSRASSPARAGSHSNNANVQASTLPVRSSRPIGAPMSLSASGEASQQSLHRHPSCKKVADEVYEAHLHSLVTPRTSANGSNSKRIRYVILEVRSHSPWSSEFLSLCDHEVAPPLGQQQHGDSRYCGRSPPSRLRNC